MPHKRYLSLLITVFLVHSFFRLSVVSAQPSANEVDIATREVDHSMREEAEKKLMLPPKRAPKIKEEVEVEEDEGPKFLVKKIKLVGVVSVSPEDFKPIIDKYENRELSIGKLNTLAKEIEREYLRKGIIAACFIPPQDIQEGTVTLQVVEARMGALRINDHNYFDKDMIARYWTIRPGQILRYDKMSRSVQLMNKNPDRSVNATLHAGKRPGTTDVLVTAMTRFPIHGFCSFDREGSVSTGRERTGLGIRDNNFLFVDDTLLAGTTFGKDFTGWYAYHSVPITNFGTTVMYGYSDSRSAPKKEFESFVIRSEAQNGSCFVHQDLYDKAEYVGELSVGLDLKDKSTRSTSGTLSRDRLRVARLKATLIHRYPGCVTYMNPEISQGLNILGARRKNRLSSRDAENTFTKFNLGLSHRRALPLGTQASLKFKWQVASEKLTSQEQFALGGIDSVRGYPSQDFMADTGFQTNVELLLPSFWIPEKARLPYSATTLRDDVTGLVFFDQGYGKRRGTESTDLHAEVNYASVGAELRIRLYNQSLIRLAWGFPIGDAPITEAEHSRFHISVNFEDKFPEEIERIKKIRQEAHLKELAWKLLDDEMERPESPLKRKMYKYLTLARLAYKQNRLEEAKSYYAKIQKIGNSLYAQSENYIKDSLGHEEELKKYNKEAIAYYKQGDIEKAKGLWQKIEKEAQVKPLVLEVREE